MKPYFQVLLLIAICLLSTTLAADVYALSASGSGSISYEGTGSVVHMAFPIRFVDIYGEPCTPGQVGLVITTCHDALDTSLLGNEITRAEDVRISGNRSDFFVRFGCASCGSTVFAEELVTISPFLYRLSDTNAARLQALIDQYGPASIRIGLSLSGSFSPVSVFSARHLVQVDVKPGSEENRANPRSRGLLSVAILTTSQFDASSVDVDTIQFGVSGHEGSPKHSVLDDVDGDGDLDLHLFFPAQTAGLECQTQFTYLRGETLNGDLIAGTDSITTVGCN